MSTSDRPAALGVIGFMIAAVVFAVLAGVLLSQLLEGKYSKEPVEALVVAKRGINAGQQLTSGDLTLAEWPQSSIPDGAFKSLKKALAVKRVSIVPLSRGQALLETHLAQQETGLGVATMIGPEMRAFAVRTDDAVSLSGLLYPGARVDVLSTVRRQAETGPRVKTRIVLQNLKVLAVGTDIDPLTIAQRKRDAQRKAEEDEDYNETDYDARERRAVVTVEVSPEDAEKLALAAREGQLDVALRNPKSKTLVTTEGATQSDLTGDEDESEFVAPAGKKQAARGSRAARAAYARRKMARRRKQPTFSQSASVSESPATVKIYRGGKQ